MPFLATRLGQTLVLVLASILTAFLCWWGFSSYYLKKGREQCQNETAIATAKANVAVIDAQNVRDSTSSTVAAAARENAKTAVNETAAKTQTRQETIRDEYRKPPMAVAPCTGVAPVPERVQHGIESAVREANAAAR